MEGLGTAITKGIETITTVMTSSLELAVSNPLIMIFVVSGIVGIAIGMFRKLKKVAK